MMKYTENKTFRLKDGRNLGYAEYGDSKGKPLLFFHGWPGSRLQAKNTDEIARKLKVRVICIDRPGYGLSDFNPHRLLLDFPDDVVALADSLRIKKFAIVGVSGGGPYAAVCAYKIPQRLTRVGIVVGLAPTDIDGVLHGMAFTNKLLWRFYNKVPFLMSLSSTLLWLEAKKYFPEKLSFAYRERNDKQLLQIPNIRKQLIENRKEAFRQGKRGCTMDLKLYTNNWGFELKDIKVKVFLWYGEKDKNVSLNMGKHYASQIQNSKLIIYPNEGHLIMQTHAEEILKSLIR